MSTLTERVQKKVNMDMHSPYYHTNEHYIEDLTHFQNDIKKKHGLDLTVEQCCIIWEKFSGSWSASFMEWTPRLTDVALNEYLNIVT